MAVFVIRRLLISIGVLIVATFVMYVLTATSGDPLDDLYGITDAGDRASRIAARTKILQLNVPVVERYFHWLGGLLAFLWGHGTLGTNRTGQPVGPLLQQAVSAR